MIVDDISRKWEYMVATLIVYILYIDEWILLMLGIHVKRLQHIRGYHFLPNREVHEKGGHKIIIKISNPHYSKQNTNVFFLFVCLFVCLFVLFFVWFRFVNCFVLLFEQYWVKTLTTAFWDTGYIQTSICKKYTMTFHK